MSLSFLAYIIDPGFEFSIFIRLVDASDFKFKRRSIQSKTHSKNIALTPHGLADEMKRATIKKITTTIDSDFAVSVRQENYSTIRTEP